MVLTYTRYLFIFFFIIFLSGCSTISEKLDIAGIIDKTESLIFGSDEEEAVLSEEISTETDIEKQEDSYPDISEVPQDRPDIPEIDKSFFEGENKEDRLSVDEIIVSNTDINSETAVSNVSVQSNESEPSIKAIANISYRMRLKVRSLLAYSDPPTDMTKKMVEEKPENIKKNYSENSKLAIIQFPNNSTIPDNSAQAVINEISRLYKNSKFMLIGHSSSLGSETSAGKKINMEISFARANTIKKMLIEQGFSKDDIFIQGRGDLEPLQDASKNYGEAANRRVEIFFISE